MKKVLLIAAALYIGGAERVARDIGYYSGDQFEVHYLVFGDRVGEYEEELLKVGCKIIHADPPAAGHLSYYRFLCYLIQREHYDVIHAHTMFNSGWAMLAGKRCGVPVRICHSHSALDVHRSLLIRTYETAMRQLILRCATSLVACGKKAGVRLYGAHAFSEEGILLLNGVDADRFAFQRNTRSYIRQQLGVENKYVIGHVGHLADVKNQQFLIGLMPKLLQQRPDAFLLLLGEGENRKMLEQKIGRLKLQAYVAMTGNVSNVPDYLSAMDVFAFPSLFEGMPLSILEVQANGLPCIISDRVPTDVYATDLMTPLSLDDEHGWIHAILSASRSKSEAYADEIKQKGLDLAGFLSKIYRLYDGDTNKGDAF